MKEKTSITLEAELLRAIDRLAGAERSRSAVIEHVLRRYLRDEAHARIQARDVDLLNQAADELNAEATDVLDYQTNEG
jgi:metal-responsive CopG/Arc/MetJ family transcriptional regulator